MVHETYMHDKSLSPIYCNPLPISYLEPTCITIDWPLSLVGLMWPKKVVIVLCWWAFVVIFLSFKFSVSLEFWWKQPQVPLVLVFHYCMYWAKAFVKEAMYLYLISLKQYNGKHSECSLGSTLRWHNGQIISSQKCLCISAYLYHELMLRGLQLPYRIACMR